MKLDPNSIAKGLHNGEIVWVCDFRRPSINEKPIRSIKPTQVLIRSNTETKERVYYSDSHFAILGKDGKPTAKIHKLFDNTGFRSFTGTPLNVFDNAKECVECYKDQCLTILTQVEAWYVNQTALYNTLKTELTKEASL